MIGPSSSVARLEPTGTDDGLVYDSMMQTLADNQLSATDSQRPAEPGIARRLLFLLPFAPRLDASNGGSRVLAELLLALSQRHQLAVLYLRAADEPAIDETLHQHCAIVGEVSQPAIERSWQRRVRHTVGLLRGRPMWATDWRVPAFAERVRALAAVWQPDIVQIEFPVMGQYLSALADCPAPRVLVDHDAGPQAARDLLATKRGFGRALQHSDVWAWQRFERALFTQVQSVVVFSERDEQALARFAGKTPLLRIPAGARLPERALDPRGSTPERLVFIGSFGHYPNADAAIRLAGTIFPQLRARFPQLKLQIIGNAPPPELQQLADERISVTGRVPDVTPYLDQAALVVSPLRLGGGMRVKVLEALAAGKAIVASPLSIEGLDLADGQQIALAESDQQFVDQITQLLLEPARRVALAERSRTWACSNLSWNRSVALYERLYAILLHSRQFS